MSTASSSVPAPGSGDGQVESRHAAMIKAGITSLGIEFGSTRIKAVLVDEQCVPLASGTHDWESDYVDGVWTYSEEAIIQGLQACFGALRESVKINFQCSLNKVGSIGISAMMHGYLPFDAEGNLLAPFRTWRNTFTERSSTELTALFGKNIPQRWSIAHLHRSLLLGEEHISRLSFLTTLSGYVHWRLTGEKVLGIGDAAGMFPVDAESKDYHKTAVTAFNGLQLARNNAVKIESLLPTVLVAGRPAGRLTAGGAALLDPSGEFEAGALMCPPEGDAGTGMVATNSVLPQTGNVSVGTSIFAMVVLEKSMDEIHTELDMVSTPAGAPVAMVHCNNGTAEMGVWVDLFREVAELAGAPISERRGYELLLNHAETAVADGSEVLAFNYISGEHITTVETGHPMILRQPGSSLTAAGLMRAQLWSVFATLRIGLDILAEEGVSTTKFVGHGGLFNTAGVGQRMMASALQTPVALGESAGEGGAWGAAILAAFTLNGRQMDLPEYLAQVAFSTARENVEAPRPAQVEEFNSFMAMYRRYLPLQQDAVGLYRQPAEHSQVLHH